MQRGYTIAAGSLPGSQARTGAPPRPSLAQLPSCGAAVVGTPTSAAAACSIRPSPPSPAAAASLAEMRGEGSLSLLHPTSPLRLQPCAAATACDTA